MFTWLNKQGVQNDGGFIVQFTGRFTAEYRDGGDVVTLDVESGMSGGRPSILVDPSAFDRWDNGRAISTAEREQLFRNLREAMEFQGLRLVVQAAERRE